MVNKKNRNSNAIRVEGVYKSFRLPHDQHSGIKQVVLNIFKKNKKRGYEIQHVLNGVSFEIKKGEFFGIVGRNGSGKSTLLKLLSGIYRPDAGKVSISGSLTPFIELGVGFNPELTGRENVFLNGALLGFSRKQMESMYGDIVSFSELERFMDQKLKNYSSGMQVRLAFSIAIRSNTDILILDEVLAVGDSAFQQKCFDYFSSLKHTGKTVVLVSHSMASIERFCTRALLLEKGEVVSIGNSSTIAYEYENLFIDDSNKELLKKSGQKTKANQARTADVLEVEVSISQGGKEVAAVQAQKPFGVEMTVMSRIIDLENLNVGINIRDSEDRIVFSTDMRKHHDLIKLLKNNKVSLRFNIENYYTNGKYFIDAVAVDEYSLSDKLLFKEKSLREFDIKGIRDHAHSLFHPPFSVDVQDSSATTNRS